MSVSWGQIAGAVVGGVIGYFVGGGFYGAFVGASIGYSLGSIVDPVTPDVKTPGVPVQPFQICSNEIGSPIADALGTVKVAGHLLAYGEEEVDPIRERVGGGKGGGGGSKAPITGYRYYASWALGICLGPVDSLYTIFKDEKMVWEGEEIRPVSGGETTIVIEDFGSVTFYFGTDDQVPNDDMGDIIENDNLNSPFRGLCWVFFDHCYLGDFNRLPTMVFVLRRTPTISFSALERVRLQDYNPAHALWYILTKQTALPATWLHTGDFTAMAATLAAIPEERGISMLFDQQQSALAYLEAVNMHVDGILRYGSDGKFHPKLIRNDYDLATLPVVDESMILDKPQFSRKSWIDTLNEIQVQYSKIERYYYAGTFYPFCMCTDGAYLYIAGQSRLDGKYYMRIEKRSMLGKLLDQYDVVSGNGGLACAWWSISVDEDSIYLGGYRERTPVASGFVGLVQRRKKTDISNLTWEYIQDPGGAVDYTVLDIVQEPAGDIIFTGDDEVGITTYGGRLRHDDGTVVWYFARGVYGGFDDRNAGRCVAMSTDGTEAYFLKKQGYVETVRVDDGSRMGDVAHAGRCWKKAVIWQSADLADFLYAVGHSWPEASPGVEVGEQAVISAVGVWELTHGPDVAGEANEYEALACHDFNIYVVGRAPMNPYPRMRIAKYDMALGGVGEIWAIEGTITNRCSTAICVFGQYVYVAGWDLAKAGLIFIERRSIFDGLII